MNLIFPRNTDRVCIAVNNSVITRKRYKIDAYFLLKCNRKSYALYWMVMLPMTPKSPPIFAFSSPFMSFYWVNVETSYFVYRLTVASPGLKVAWLCVWPFCNFWGPFISQKWLKLELSNLVNMEIISSVAKGMTNHPWDSPHFSRLVVGKITTLILSLNSAIFGQNSDSVDWHIAKISASVHLYSVRYSCRTIIILKSKSESENFKRVEKNNSN